MILKKGTDDKLKLFINLTGKARNTLLDATKGIGIILVVLGHSNIPNLFTQVIFAFHMPLFFFLAGMVYKRSMYSFKIFFWRKAQALLVPYMLFGVLVFLSLYYSGQLRSNWAYGFFIFGDGFNSALWFLTHLFILYVAMFFIIELFGEKLQFLIIIAILGVLFEMICTFVNLKLFWHIEIIGISSFFFLVGYILKNKIQNYLDTQKFWQLLIYILFFSLMLYLHILVYGAHIDLNSNFLGSPLLFLALASIGILLTISIANYLQNFRLFLFLGQNTLTIIGTHQAIPMLLVTFYGFIGIAITSFLHRGIVLLAILACIFFINNFAPFIIGRK